MRYYIEANRTLSIIIDIHKYSLCYPLTFFSVFVCLYRPDNTHQRSNGCILEKFGKFVV